MTVEELLHMPSLRGLQLIAGNAGIHRRISTVTVIDTPDGSIWLKGSEFVITTAYAIKDDSCLMTELIQQLVSRKASGLGIKTANPMDRSGSLADFGPDPELAAALFSARVGQWLPTAFAVSSPKEGQGAVLVHVGAVQPPDSSEWDMIKDIMAGAVERERVQGLYETFMQRLLSTAKVEVLNMDIVDRKNM